jgi:demethylmenaquinone methyltransferase/2-methoxy-6-polyprenyl-1,4-benzoquinol methylase
MTMPRADPSMQAYYAARAREYDRVYAKPERQADLRAIERWLPPLFAGARVLEVACGTGYWTQFIATVASQVLAVDVAAQTLAIARGRVPQPLVEFVVGDAYVLPARAAQFDAAFAGFWFSHVPQSRQLEFLRGLHVTLRPGARVVLLDNRYVEGSSSPVTSRDADGNTYQTRSLSDGTAHRVLKNFPSGQELQALIARLGSNATITTWPYYWALAYEVAAA